MPGPTFDAIAPSSTGASNSGSATLTWAHTVGSGSNRLILVGFTMNPVGSDTGYSIVSVTCSGAAMTQLGTRHTDDQTAGFMAAYQLINPSSGSNTITVTLSASADVIVGGSISFSDADQTTGTATPVVQAGDSGSGDDIGSASITVTSSTSDNTIVGFLGAGSGALDSDFPGTSQIENNDNTDDGAGCFSLQTIPATGSAVTLGWSGFNDWWAGVAVEVLGVSGGGGDGGDSAMVAWLNPYAGGTPYLLEDLESGTNGSTITSANTDFDSTFGAGSAVFDSTLAASGTLSAKLTSNGTTGNYIQLIRNLPGDETNCYIRFAVYLSSLPASNLYVCNLQNHAGLTELRINTAGTITVTNNGVAAATSTHSVPVGQWFVLEWNVNSGSATQSARLYSGTNGSPLETISGPYTQGAFNSYATGIAATNSITIWVDAVGISLADWVGPLSA